MPGTIKNHMLLDRYKELVEKLYIEPKNEIIIGNFLTSALSPTINIHKVEIQDEREKSRRNNQNDNQPKMTYESFSLNCPSRTMSRRIQKARRKLIVSL